VNIRTCKLCGKEVDFDEPWCDHETMEESGLLDMRSRIKATVEVINNEIDKIVHEAAKELGWQASETWKEQMREELDS